MAAISNRVGAEANPSNVLLMHAMGPNVTGVIGSAVAAESNFNIWLDVTNISDIETDGFVKKLTRIHCIVIQDTETKKFLNM